MEFDAIESRALSPHGSIRKQPRQRHRQLANLCKFCIRNSLPMTEAEILKFPRRQNTRQFNIRQSLEPTPHLTIVNSSERLPVRIGYRKELLQKPGAIGSTTNGKKIDQLNE
jgi:hypothetical protein